MNRREFLASAAAVPIVTAMPASVASGAAFRGRWYAVGDGEMSHPFWATSRKEAARFYADEFCATLGDDCPECGAVKCSEHMSPSSFDEPQGWVQVDEPGSWSDIPVEREPTDIEWLTAGYNVPCAWCKDEQTECWPFEGEALCESCVEIAQQRKIDRILGHRPGKCACGRPWASES